MIPNTHRNETSKVPNSQDSDSKNDMIKYNPKSWLTAVLGGTTGSSFSFGFAMFHVYDIDNTRITVMLLEAVSTQ